MFFIILDIIMPFPILFCGFFSGLFSYLVSFTVTSEILRNNYYNPRSKKVLNLIKNLENKDFKQVTLGGCLFIKKRDELCLKLEKN